VLLVLDGAKALHAAAKRVWGPNGVIPRCRVHEIARTAVAWHGCAAPIGMAKLLVRTALPDLDKSQRFQGGYHLLRFEHR